MGGRNDEFSQRCGRKTLSKENHISKLKDNVAWVYTPRFLLNVSDKKKLQNIRLLFLYLSLCKIFRIVLVLLSKFKKR